MLSGYTNKEIDLMELVIRIIGPWLNNLTQPNLMLMNGLEKLRMQE